MSFNWNKFKEHASDNSFASLNKIKGTANRLARHTSPLRGCFNKFGSISRCEEWYGNIYSKLMKYIDDEVPAESRDSIKTMEEFQVSQKGPAGPITKDQFYNDVTEKFLKLPSISILAEDKIKLRTQWEKIKLNLKQYVAFNVREIRFDLKWRELPGSTVRGFPYHDLGSNVDDDIIKVGGMFFDDALRFFKSQDQIVSFPGYRIQGKPLSKGAKIRLINIPPVFYQYINVGIYKTSMSKLKYHPAFSGWLHPDDRAISIENQIKRLKQEDYSFIALDFSSFDTTCSLFFRQMINEFVVEADTSKSLSDYKEHFDRLNENQYLIIPTHGSYQVVDAPDMLLSGVINTQHDGSLINMLVQAYCASELGFEFRPEFSLVLGDDVGFAVPNKYLRELGYKGLLEKINQIANKIGFVVHTGKAYPNTDLIFLQKLYAPDSNIMGLGSWARCLSSFIYKEKFSTQLPGIKSIPVLELISQIAILNEGFGSSKGGNHNGFIDEIVKEWLPIDDLLIAVCQWLDKSQPNWSGHDLMRSLINFVSRDFDSVFKVLGVTGYDHKGIVTSIQDGSDYGKTFPCLSVIKRIYSERSFPEKNLAKLIKFESLDEVVDEETVYAGDE